MVQRWPEKEDGDRDMTEAEQAFWKARDDYLNAKTVYNMFSDTDHEGALYHTMQAAWERLRAANREIRRERGLAVS